MSKKQATLFQSWGNKTNKSEQKSDHQVATATTTSVNDDVIDLCGSFEDEDDDLLWEAEESISNIGSVNGIQRATNNSLAINHDQDPHVGDVSVGADGFMPTQAQSQNSNLTGFDKSAGKLWIYPTNYPVREYQFAIVKQAMFKNTMVTLPTGLGKTFIAAVVMYNFYRWYPQGKVIFMAPTKPLVAQQIEACYNIMGIPQDHTAEMTGSMGPAKRERAWRDKRVFFLTPQVLTNDLSRGSCPAHDVKCLVIDEAHKALGNHAYCQVVRELVKYTENFRILSLSATPGSDIKAVQQVLNNLLISQIEIRTEESHDIKKYSHERKVDKVVVPLGDELTKVKTKYIQIMDVVVNKLKRNGVLYNRDTTSLSKFLILKAREAFRQNPPEKLQRNQYGIVEGDFALAMSLYHGFELLQLHGSRSLYNFLDGILTGDKGYGRTRTELSRNADFNELMGLLSGKYRAPESETASQAKAKPFVIGHPKMEKLQEIVLDHFNTHSDAGTRVMIFSQYRDSVQEITDMLHIHQPIIKVMSFIGQATAGKSTKGFTQKEQLKVMKQFREGGYNTLVSTCVGEEGLDIGDVDLIICFDAHKSPIRLVQRMGRTGRKREGRIVMLVTQGKEEQIYNQSQYSKKSIHKAILNGAKSLHFYQHSPRMLPENSVPACHKMHITVKENFKPTKKISTDKEINQSKITSLMNNAATKKDQSEEIITLEEYRELEPWLVPKEDIPKLPAFHLTCLENQNNSDEQQEGGRLLSLSEWTPWQNALQDTELVDHSLGSKHLVQVMEFIQLQQSLDSSDDPYGLEMAAYLNDEDILKPGETEVPTLLPFWASKQKKANDDKSECGKKTVVKPKSRRSENLPKFDFLDDKMEISSDESLPDFDIGHATNDNCDIEKSELVAKRKAVNVHKTIKKIVNHRKILNDEYKALPDVHEAMDITDAGENCAKENIEGSSTAMKDFFNSKKPGGFVSKAKSLEKRMTIGNIRRRKKSRQNSGHTSVIELIADNDSADFDCSPGVPDVLKHPVDDTTVDHRSEHINEEICQVLSDSSDSELCKIGSFKDISTEVFRIRTPPSIEDVAQVCEAFEIGSRHGDLDLIDAIDEWHMENRHGKYIVYPESMMNDSLTESFSEMKSRKKMSISIVDELLSESVSKKKLIDSDNVVQMKDMDNKVDEHQLNSSLESPINNISTESNTSVNSGKEIKQKKKKLFKSPLNEKQIGKITKETLHFVNNEIEVDNTGNSIIKSPTYKTSTNDKKQKLKEKESKLIDVEGESVIENNDMNEEDDIACTGNFMLNADDMFSTNDDWMADDLDDIHDKPDEFESPVFGASDNKEVNENKISDNDRLDIDLERTDVIGTNTTNEESRHSSYTSHADTSRITLDNKHRFVNGVQEEILSSSDESYSNRKVKVPFSELDKSKYDSFLSDDKDDDLFKDIKTPSRTKSHDTSTQITFTQALNFVHSGKAASGSSETCNKSHSIGLGQDRSYENETYINTKKNGLTENISPKFSLKRSLIGGLNSTDESVSDDNERKRKDVSELDDTNISSDGKNCSNEDLLKKKLPRKSSSSESIGEMPEFDLGFEFDDDVIPPSPKVVQLSQRSTSNRLSQAFACTSRLSQSRCETSNETSFDDRNENKKENFALLKIDKGNKERSIGDTVLKSRKKLNLFDKHKENLEKSIIIDKEESQSLLNDIANVPNRSGCKKAYSNFVSTKFDLNTIQENSENELLEDSEKCVVNRKELSGPLAIKSNLEEENDIDGNCTGAFETSFALLGEDFEDWIDSGGNAEVKYDQKPYASLEKEQKKDTVTHFDENNRCDSFLTSQKSIGNFQRQFNTPVAAVSPISVSQEKHDKDPVTEKEVKSSHLKLNKNVRKSVFKLDDISSDSFDDSFNFTSDMLDKSHTRTSLGAPSALHNTSTPLIHHSKKVQSVTPFRISEINTPLRSPLVSPMTSKFSLPDLNTHSPFGVMERTTIETPIQRQNVSTSHPSNINSSEEKDDDSFIVRRKKKVKILDSPLTQIGKPSNNSSLEENYDNVNRGKSNKCAAFLISSDDDDGCVGDDNDDFDDSFLLTKNNYTKKKPINQLEHSSDEDIEESFVQPGKQIPRKNSTKDERNDSKGKEKSKTRENAIMKNKANRKRTSNPFIEEEAELSEEGDSNASSDEHDGSDLDRYEGSFISDSQNTQSQALNNTDVHALYLKSVKSPIGHRGGYKLQFNHRNDIDVFSQRPPPEDSHYMEDSFCVGSEVEEEEDDWLLREEGEESEEELREVTLMQNSVMQTGRKRRKGLHAFQTSRQRAIQMGRMKALSEIRTKLAGKMKRPAQNQNLSSHEDETEKISAPKNKRSRIHLNNDTSSDEETKLPLNQSDLMSPKALPVQKTKKRGRLLLSSDESESDGEFNESKSMCRSNKYVKVVNESKGSRQSDLKVLHSADELKQERLRKQKEKQAEYRRQLEQKKLVDSKGLDSISENPSSIALTKLKEKSVVDKIAHNDDFDFVRPLSETKLDNTDLLVNSTMRHSKFDGKLVILVDSKEISGSQDIISDLRFKQDINVSAAQLQGCDYIVSNRMAVERKQWSEFSNGSNRAKLIERMQHLGELYDRPCLIVEKDRIKPGEEKSARPVHWTKYVDRTIALLLRSDIKLLFTDNFSETAVLLADLCRLEQRKNMAIQVPVELNDEQIQRVKFFVSLPKLSYVHALNLCEGFRSVSDFLKSSAVVIESRGKMSKNRAHDVYNYIRRMFDQNMLPTNYK